MSTLTNNGLPDKTERPRAHDYDKHRYQWRYGRIPGEIKKDGVSMKSPFLETGVFIVHGIGDQEDADSAVSMRLGVEDALQKIELKNWSDEGRDQWILPAPYLYDGYWAKYTDLETFADDLQDDLAVLTERQAHFFRRAWAKRASGWWRSYRWMIKQGWKLVLSSEEWQETLFYGFLTILLVLFLPLTGLIPAARNFLRDYISDARLYLEPKGDFELEMVQLIDRRVGRAFLRMLGLDWDFRTLDKYKGLVVNGQPKTFDRVVWVAHSLGTVISYNVIGDILNKCQSIRDDFNGKKLTKKQNELLKNIGVVEEGIARFITFGSPLDKVLLLYQRAAPSVAASNGTHRVLRRWPDGFLSRANGKLNEAAGTGDRNLAWWINFFYISDPISGRLDEIATFIDKPGDGVSRLIRNLSPRGWRLPIDSHNRYWKDPGFATKVLEAALFGYTKEVLHLPTKRQFEDAVKEREPGISEEDIEKKYHFVRVWPEQLHNWLIGTFLFFLTVTVIAALILAWWLLKDYLWPLLQWLMMRR